MGEEVGGRGKAEVGSWYYCISNARIDPPLCKRGGDGRWVSRLSNFCGIFYLRFNQIEIFVL